jgi:hypothetical protein
VVFQAAVEAGMFPVAVLGVLGSVVGAFYYLKVVKVMYFDEPAGKAPGQERLGAPGDPRAVRAVHLAAGLSGGEVPDGACRPGWLRRYCCRRLDPLRFPKPARPMPISSRALAAGEAVAEGDWLVADRQSAGRGRQGRAWFDGFGNFMGSTVVRPAASW